MPSEHSPRPPHSGETYRFRPRTISEEDLTGLRREAPDAGGGFDDRLALDMLTLTLGLAAAPVGPDMRVRRLHDVTFERPVRAGDVITVEMGVDRSRTLDEGGLELHTRWRVVDQRGDLLMRLNAQLLCGAQPEVGSTPKGISADFPPEQCAPGEPELDCVQNIPV